MKVPFVPGPSDVLAAVDGLRDGLGDALELVPRLFHVVDGVEQLLGRVGGLLDRVDVLVDRVDGVVGSAEGVVGTVEGVVGRVQGVLGDVDATRARADAAIEQVGRTNDKADAAIEQVGGTTGRADGLLDRTEALVGRVDPLLGAYADPLTTLAPSVRRLAETLDPDEVEALVRLVDQLPTMVDELERNVLPTLNSLGNVGDDVHDLLDTMQDLRQVVKGFPGSRLFRRRGAEEIASDDAEDEGTGS